VNAFTKLITETLGAFNLPEKHSKTHCMVLTRAGSKARAQIKVGLVQPIVHDVYQCGFDGIEFFRG
jgi:hypothetical protein